MTKFSALDYGNNNKNPSADRRAIKQDERYQDADGYLGKIINALDYAGNVSRSGIYGASKGKGWEYLKQALMMDRYTDPSKVKNLVGVSNVGKDDGKFQLADTVDFATDVGADILTDPLNLLSLGTSGLAKSIGKSAAKEGASSVGDAALKLAKKTDLDAKRLEFTPTPTMLDDLGVDAGKQFNFKEVLDAERTARNLVEPALGFTYGYGFSDADASLAEKLGLGLAGAAGFPAVRHLAAPIGKRLLVGGKTEGKIANKALNSISKNVDPWIEKILPGNVKAVKAVDDKVAKATKTLAPDRVKKSDLGNFLKGSDDAIGAFGKTSDAYFEKFGKEFREKIRANPKYKALSQSSFFNSISKTYKIAKEGLETRQKFMKNIYRMKSIPYEGLNDAQKVELFELNTKYRQKFLEERNKRWNEYVKKFGKQAGLKPGAKFGNSKDPAVILKGKMITEEVNREMTPKIIREVEEDMGEDWAKRLEKVVETNHQSIMMLNNRRLELAKKGRKEPKDMLELQKLEESVARDSFQVAPIDFHAPIFKEVPKKKLRDEDELFLSKNNSNMAFKPANADGVLSESTENILGVQTANRQLSVKEQAKEIDAANEMYAKQMVSKFLTQEQNNALQYLSAYNQRAGMLPWALRGFDRVQGFMKKNLLYASLSWLVNNYWDNLQKTYVETGLFNTLKVGALGALNRDIAADIGNATLGKVNAKRYSESFEDLAKRGIIEDVQLKELESGNLQQFLFSEQKLADMADKTKEKGNIRKLFDKGYDAYNYLLDRTTGRAGSYIENIGKAITYEHTLKKLKEADSFKHLGEEQLKDMAAKVTEDTFFNYSSVHHIEDAFMKRMLPFYSFYKANSIYWADVISDPIRAARLANLQSGFDAIGDPLTEFDRDALPKYFRGKNARRLGQDEIGQRYAVVTNFSAYDFMNMTNPEGAIDAITEKMSPLIKAVQDLHKGRDSFTGQALYPSDKRDGKAYLYSRGFSYYMLQEGLDFILRTDDLFDVSLDKKGNPVTTSDKLIVFDKLMGTMIPFKPIADQVAGSVGKVAVQGRENVSGAFANRLLPVKTPVVTREQQFQNLKWNKIDQAEKKKEEAERLRQERIDRILNQ